MKQKYVCPLNEEVLDICCNFIDANADFLGCMVVSEIESRKSTLEREMIKEISNYLLRLPVDSNDEADKLTLSRLISSGKTISEFLECELPEPERESTGNYTYGDFLGSYLDYSFVWPIFCKVTREHVRKNLGINLTNNDLDFISGSSDYAPWIMQEKSYINVCGEDIPVADFLDSPSYALEYCGIESMLVSDVVNNTEGWIPTSERVPLDGPQNAVLGCDAKRSMYITYRDADCWKGLDGSITAKDSEMGSNRIVAWQPLPIPCHSIE